MKRINRGISVIVCCYNSAERLPETIRHIALQRVPDYIPWEVVVVNNASKDSTTKIALQEWKKYNCVAAFQVINQSLPGKKVALKKGIKIAKYEYLLICDDDNWLQPDYVKTAYEVMEQHPEVAVVGGRGQAVFDSDVPAWFKEHEEHFGIGPQAHNSGYVSPFRNWVYGAGSVIRKLSWETVIKAGFRGIVPGPVGSRFSGGGEDVELCYAMKLAGYEIWYEDQLRFLHFMPETRLNWQYFLKLIRTTARLSIFLKVYTIILSGSLPISSSKAAVRLTILRSLYLNLKKLIRIIVKKFSRFSFKFEGNNNDLIIIRSLTAFQICIFNFFSMEKNYFSVLNFAHRVGFKSEKRLCSRGCSQDLHVSFDSRNITDKITTDNLRTRSS